jgi:hypothetical protein
MKMTKFGLSALVLLTIGTVSFRDPEVGAISGKITPVDGAKEVWAIKGADTLKALVTDDVFSLQPAMAGAYTVIINAKDPYKNATLEDVDVKEGKVTDLGEIKLEQ